ncbi:glycosyltransferase 61 family protein [Qipengyuania atrilutea]|uniref:Glycosyltransferase family 61 protein n=1 Tax=Qipengyuania atrilutea TaxID=2744473 RepID=A0A850H0M2_9SPHN|nr:glycosyltransferase 61 family protein [Actirhodobacter atriluteus]NVD45441.1 glycosyltransferase family 61 protein [Actirhodobacter atriluteus]
MMSKSIWPITSRLSQRIRHRSIEEVASKVVTFDEGRNWNARPLVHLPGELDKITGHHPDSTPARNIALIDCNGVRQGASKAYLLKDALVADGTILTKSYVQYVRDQSRRWFLPRISKYHGEAALVSTEVSERYFGHWLHDQLPLEILVHEQGHVPISVAGTIRPSELGYRTLSKLACEKTELMEIENLWVHRDFEVTSDRMRRLELLRNRLRTAKPAQKHSADIVFLKRGPNAVGRSLIDEDRISSELERHGVRTILPEAMQPDEIVDALKNAKIAIGAEGSAFAHAICALPSGASILTLLGPNQFNLHWRLYCEALNLEYGIIVGETTGTDSFSVNTDTIMRTIDLLNQKLR